MINASALPRRSVVGRLARLPARLIPPHAQIPILQGALRGQRWVVGSSTHGCWLGSYEADKQARFVEVLRPGHVVFDIGAHVGFYTLLSSVLVGPSGRVFAFEPLPRNIGYLRKHVALNHRSNVTVVEAAVSDRGGKARFAVTTADTEGHLGAGGGLEVVTLSLDAMFSSSGDVKPNVMKIDVEGEELKVLQGAWALLQAARPILFLATHAPALERDCIAMLTSLEYRFQPLKSDTTDPEKLKEYLAVPAGSSLSTFTS